MLLKINLKKVSEKEINVVKTIGKFCCKLIIYLINYQMMSSVRENAARARCIIQPS